MLYIYDGTFRINWDDAGGPQLESVASVGGRFVMAMDPYGEKIPVTVANTGNTDYLYTAGGNSGQNEAIMYDIYGKVIE